MELLLELLKYSLPALVVGATAYYLIREFLSKQYQIQLLEYKSKQQKDINPLRLQAYERLSIFCERSSIPNLLMRMRSPEMDANTFKMTLMIATKQEYEHNIAQQIYVSDILWKIIKTSKEDILATLEAASEGLSPKATSEEYVDNLIKLISSSKNPMDTALSAIKQEVGYMF